MIEYFILLGAFSTMFLLAFLPGYLEYRRPRDPGPLDIELARVIDPRSEAIRFRRSIEPLAESQGWSQKQLCGTLVHEREFKNSRGSLKVMRVDGNITVPAGSVIESALMVSGELVSQENCRFTEMVYVKGPCQLGRRNKLTAVTSVGNLSMGEGSEVLSFVDSDGAVRIGGGCVIGGIVSSGEAVTIEGPCDARTFHSRFINIISHSSS